MAILTSDSNILAQVLYQDQSTVELIGDVNCPNKKSRGEKCVYLKNFAELNKSTYDFRQCETCSHVLNIRFNYQKPCVTLFGWTDCFRKKTKLDYQKKKLSPLMRQYISQSKLSTTKAEEAEYEPVPKKHRFYFIWNNRVTLLLVVLLQKKVFFFSLFHTFLQLRNTLVYNQHNAIYSLQQRNTVAFRLCS